MITICLFKLQLHYYNNTRPQITFDEMTLGRLSPTKTRLIITTKLNIEQISNSFRLRFIFLNLVIIAVE